MGGNGSRQKKVLCSLESFFSSNHPFLKKDESGS